MPGFIWDFLSTEGFQPHGMCLLWRPDVFWAHAVSDLVIALSYFSIPGALIYLAARRADLVYRWVIYLFGAFIVACGLTHLLALWTMWIPDYGLQAIVKVGTALVSLTTALALWPLMPKLISIPSNRQLEDKNVALAREIAEREAAEAKLKALNEQLERRVLQRTQSLQDMNTALSESRMEAEHANKAKDRFLAKMSHELRTPLNAIIGFSELMKDEVLGTIGTPRYRDYINDIHDSGNHLLDLINDILDLSKVQSGQDRLVKEDIDVAELLQSIVTLVSLPAKRQDIAVQMNVPIELPTLHADRRKLKQILINLMSNAIKFTPPGGRVALEARCLPDRSYQFTVTDTGIGMDPDDVPLAFVPFQQVDNRLNRSRKGTGLGLPLSKALVELHRGHLDLQSSVDAGTKVSVVIPNKPLANAVSRPDALPVQASFAS